MNPKPFRRPTLALVLSLLLVAALPAAPRILPRRARRPGSAASGSRGAATPAPDRGDASESAERRTEIEYFRHLVGGNLDVARTREMWKEAQAVPSEAQGTAAVNAWQLVGPIYSTNVGGGRMTGRVRDIDAVNLRVLAASGGLWRFNYGAVPMSDAVPASRFGAFATSPSDPNTILLGTGEYAYGGGTGLYKSTDGGATWALKPMVPTPWAFLRIRYSPDGSVVHAATTFGYFRSTDGGDTWTNTLGGTATDLSTVAGDPSLVFVTLQGSGLWRSTDAGVTWSQVTGGGIPTTGTGLGAVSAILTSPSGPLWIYVAFDTAVWRSTDGGVTWSDVSPPYNVGNSGYGPVISVCPGDPNTVLYGNVSFNRSTDAGANWSKIVSSNLHADYHVFAWDADGVGVWAGNDGGWFHSADRGQTWDSSANVMPITQFYNIDCEKSEIGYMIGGTQDNNTLFTPNQALYWTDPALHSTEGDAMGVCINLYDPTQMWAVSGEASGSYTFPRFRTTDGGQTWQEVNSGIDPNSYWGGEIRTDNAYPVDLVTSAGPYVYESTDGTTWAKSNLTPFPANISHLTSSTRVSPNAVLYAALSGTGPGRLYVRDGGTWYERSSGLPAGGVTKVVPHPWAAYANEAWALMSTTSGSRIFYTTDRGVSWTDITGDFPTGVPITDLVPNPRTVGELYVGTMLGCYRSKNGGVNWERWNNGMPQSAIVSEMSYIDLTPSTGQFFVVAGTFGRSVWKRDVSGEDVFPTLAVSDAVVQEGDAGTTTAWFQVKLSAPQTEPVLVDYATADSTATIADNDYADTHATLTFPAGATTEWITVPVNGDTQIEPDEYFKLVLSNPVRADVTNYGVGTIQDDDTRRTVCQDLFVTNGSVTAVATSGNTVYVGGNFTRVGPASGGAVPIDAATGEPLWLPKVAGYVNAAVPDGAGGWYLGGGFSYVGGIPRRNLAHIRADHTLDPWNPSPDDVVSALAVSGDTVFVGGNFTSVAGIARNHLAAISIGGGLYDWNPGADGQVLALSLSGGELYAAGTFTTIGGQSRNRVAAVSTATGLADAWDPNADSDVDALVVDGGTVFVSGNFTNVGGQARNHLAALDPVSGAATGWNPNPDGVIFAFAADANDVYVSGTFANIGGQARAGLAAIDRSSGLATAWAPGLVGDVISLAVGGGTVYAGGTYTSIGGQARSDLAALDATTGLATPWNPDPNSTVTALAVNGGTVLAGGVFSSLGAQPRNSIAALDAVTGMVTPWNPDADGSVLSLVPNGGVLYAGGNFSTIGGQPRSRIAALDSLTGLATAWDPNANSTVRSMLLSGSRLYVGGNFTSIGGQARNHIAALSTASGGAYTWNPNSSGPVYAMVTDGTYVYAGGAFTTIGGQARTALAALSVTNGAAAAWNPNPDNAVNALALDGTILYVGGNFLQIAGVTRHRLAVLSLSPVAVGSWNPSPNGNVFALQLLTGSQLYVGGAFTNIQGEARAHLALLRASTSQVSSWSPNPDNSVTALALGGSTLYAGGTFSEIGGMPQSRVACIVPTSVVGVPPPSPVASLSLELSPNPTTGRVRLEYTLPEAGRVRIGVYDLQGRRVGRSIDELEPAGPHEAAWDAADGPGAVPPGVYFVRLEAGARRAVRRFAIVR